MTLSNFVTTISVVAARAGTTKIKKTIKDSTNNNRVISVNQLVRFLSRSKSTKYRSLARKLNSVKATLATQLRDMRSSTHRTDAYDLNEMRSVLWDTFYNYNGSSTKAAVEKIIS